MQVKKQQLELGMEQQTGSKQEKEYVKAVYCHPAYLNFYAEYIMRNAGLDEAQASIKITDYIYIYVYNIYTIYIIQYTILYNIVYYIRHELTEN